MTLIVGKTEAFEARWELNGAVVSSGTATLTIWRWHTTNGKEYLQSDATTWGATQYTASMTFDTDRWRTTLAIPSSAAGYTIVAEKVHSDTSLKVAVEMNYVTTNDEDSIVSRLDNGTYGLSALNTDLDAIIARLGLTDDDLNTASTTAGTAQAKLNKILDLVTAFVATGAVSLSADG